MADGPPVGVMERPPVAPPPAPTPEPPVAPVAEVAPVVSAPATEPAAAIDSIPEAAKPADPAPIPKESIKPSDSPTDDEGEDSEAAEVTTSAVRKTEVEIIGTHIVNREVAAWASEIAGKSKDEVNALIAADKSGKKKALNELFWIQQETPALVNRDGDIPFVEGVKLDGGTSVGLLDVQSATKDTLTCTIKEGKAILENPKTVTKEEVRRALIIKNKKVILDSLPKEQKKAFEIYVDQLQKGDTAVASKTETELQALLKEAVDSTGIISGEDVSLMIDAHYEKLGKEHDTFADKFAQEAEALKKELKLEDKVIADGADLAKVFRRTGMIEPKQLDAWIRERNEQIEEITKQLGDKSLSAEQKKELEWRRTQLKLENKAIDGAKGSLEEEKVSLALEDMMRSQKKPEEQRKLKEAMRTLDSDKLIDVIVDIQVGDKEVDKTLKDAHRKELRKKLGKAGGIMALAMAIMLYTGMKSVDGQQH